MHNLTGELRVVALLCAGLLIAGAPLTGCSEDDDSTGFGTTNSTSNSTTGDAGDAIGDADATTTDDRCVDGHSLGEIQPGDEGTETLSLDSTSATGCPTATSDEDFQTAALELTTDEPVRITFTPVGDVTGIDEIGFSALNDRCDLDDAVCQDTSTATVAFDGDDRHAVLPRIAGTASSVTLDWEVREADCGPAGALGCSDGTFSVCHLGQRIDEYPCPDGCDGNTCRGDTCPTPVSVDPGTADDPAILEGHLAGLDRTDHFQQLDNCRASDTSVDDDAPELFVAIDEIPEDQQLVVESLGQGRYGFFGLTSCDADSCSHVQSDAVVETDDGDQILNEMRWAPEGGADDVLVAIRPSDPIDRSFQFGIYLAER